MSVISVFKSRHEFERAAASGILHSIRHSIGIRGICRIVLAGGDTPRTIYRLVAEESKRSDPGWQKVRIYFSDERCVPPDDAQSNYRMVKEELLSGLGIPAANVHRIRAEDSAEVAARQYEEEIRREFGRAHPAFDLIVLGMGADGHTASLFPGTDVLDEQERLVREVRVPATGAWRVTLTFPVINEAKEVMVLVAGSQKAQTLRMLFGSRAHASDLPAGLIAPEYGSLHWMLDADAASMIEHLPDE